MSDTFLCAGCGTPVVRGFDHAVLLARHLPDEVLAAG